MGSSLSFTDTGWVTPGQSLLSASLNLESLGVAHSSPNLTGPRGGQDVLYSSVHRVCPPVPVPASLTEEGLPKQGQGHRGTAQNPRPTPCPR